jgi:hypothetical protein
LNKVSVRSQSIRGEKRKRERRRLRTESWVLSVVITRHTHSTDNTHTRAVRRECEAKR